MKEKLVKNDKVNYLKNRSVRKKTGNCGMGFIYLLFVD